MIAKKETATENVKIRPSTKRRLDTFIAPKRKTYDEIVTFLLDFFNEREVEYLEKEGLTSGYSPRECPECGKETTVVIDEKDGLDRCIHTYECVKCGNIFDERIGD